ncbi:ABC transporter permease [Aquirufa sp. 5-AUSEE-100C1]
MKFPLFIARRIRSTKDTSFSKTVTYVGIGTIAMGAGIILIAFSILFGFKQAILNKMLRFSGDIRISQISENHSLAESPMTRNLAWEKATAQIPEVDHVQAHVQKPAIIVGKENMSGVVIKGIGSDMPPQQLAENMREGSSQIKNAQNIILSESLSKQLKVKLNESLILYFLSQPERPRKVKISGIYQTGLEEMDKLIVLADRSWVQKMSGWTNDSLGTYEIHLKSKIDPNSLLKTLPHEWKLETSEELYPALYDWMKMLDRNIIIFISLLMLVACFNLIATLWVLIMERVPMIGLLTALGSSPTQIRRIFWWNGFFIMLRGLAIANVFAATFCWVQATYQLIPLDPENYYMSAVPIAWDGLTWAFVNLGTVVLVSLMIYIPTQLIQKIDPKDAINYKN